MCFAGPGGSSRHSRLTSRTADWPVLAPLLTLGLLRDKRGDPFGLATHALQQWLACKDQGLSPVAGLSCKPNAIRTEGVAEQHETHEAYGTCDLGWDGFAQISVQ